jgi:hypothetical protein
VDNAVVGGEEGYLPGLEARLEYLALGKQLTKNLLALFRIVLPVVAAIQLDAAIPFGRIPARRAGDYFLNLFDPHLASQDILNTKRNRDSYHASSFEELIPTMVLYTIIYPFVKLKR